MNENQIFSQFFRHEGFRRRFGFEGFKKKDSLHFVLLHFSLCLKFNITKFAAEVSLLNSEVDLWQRLKVDSTSCRSSNGVVWRQNVHTIFDFKLLQPTLKASQALRRSTSILPCKCLKQPRFGGAPTSKRWRPLQIFIEKNAFIIKYLSKKITLLKLTLRFHRFESWQ